ncbi:uncharacterized protein LOC143620920 [Bidens hawaiensis]|uniref:uncharacterized protein LOC143620920 n=1 Tax=Bidens hawaiensis TaxID=980011 RepID=UPI0040490BD2
MKADETSSAYLTRAQEYSDALANIGEPMKEKDLVMLVLSGLREEYNGFKSTILGRQFSSAFIEIHGLLADHDYMINKTAVHISPTQAFIAARKPAAPANAGSSSLVSQADAIHAVQQLAAQLECGIGHIPFKCPNRDPATLRSRQQPSANYADHRSRAFNNWLPDTGSNNHVAVDLSSIDNSETYHGDDSLHVGNGKGLPILHIGSTRFSSPAKTFDLNNILHVTEIKQNLLSV